MGDDILTVKLTRDLRDRCAEIVRGKRYALTCHDYPAGSTFQRENERLTRECDDILRELDAARHYLGESR